MSPDRFSSVVFEGLRFALMRWVDSRMRGPWKQTGYRVFASATPSANAWITFVGVITRVATPFNQHLVGNVRVGGVDPWEGLRAVVCLAPEAEYSPLATQYLYAWLDSRESAWLWGAFTAPEAHAFAANGLWPEGLPVVGAESPQPSVPRVRGRVSP